MNNGECTKYIVATNGCLSPEFSSEEESNNITSVYGSYSGWLDDQEIPSVGELSHCDLLDSILSPTPENSDCGNFDTEDFQDFFVEETDSYLSSFQKETTNDITGCCVKDLEEPLKSHTSSNFGSESLLDQGAEAPGASVCIVECSLTDKNEGQTEQTSLNKISEKNISTQKDDVCQRKMTNERNTGGKEKKVGNRLKFPPCVICTGKASGSHYGAITCEACKGFFRRYLQKKIEYKCIRGGRCEIKSSDKGRINCSGCRLEKCLEFGMSKEKSKLGRYTLTKRTEAILDLKKVEGKKGSDSVVIEEEIPPDVQEFDIGSFNPEKEMLKACVVRNVENLNRSKGFNMMLVSELVEAFDAFQPFGPNIKTQEKIEEQHKLHSERYKQKKELFGPMKCVPRAEFNKLYEEFGIDLDSRMADMKIEVESADDDLECYYNFAKHIPGFYLLPLEDQINLLKFAMNDFFLVVTLDAYSEEYQTFIYKNGNGYHFEELADREYSRKCCTLMTDTFIRWKGLALSKEERALVAALALVATDRCKLKNHTAVEKIQISLSHLLQEQLQKCYQASACKRFTKIIDILVFTRDLTEAMMKETNLLCKDELILKEFPFMEEFVLEEK